MDLATTKERGNMNISRIYFIKSLGTEDLDE